MRRQTFFEWWGNSVDAFHYITALVVLLIGVLIFGAVVSSRYELAPETYRAWCAATKSDISYEEWKRLNIAGLLPGQPKTTTVVVPVVTR